MTYIPSAGGGAHNHTTGDGSGVLTNDEHDGYGEYAEIAAPSTPASNKLRVYAKDSGGVSRLFYKDDGGTERGPLDTPGAAGAHNHTTADGSGVLTDDEHDGFSEFAQIAAPSTPASNKVRVYAKDDGGTAKLYYKQEDGTEVGPLGAGSGTGGWTLIESQTLAVDTATITFDNIPSTYEDLILLCDARTDRATLADGFAIRFGATSVDTGNNYSSAGATDGQSQENMEWNAQAYLRGDRDATTPVSFTAANATSGRFGHLQLVVFDYASTSFQRQAQWTAGCSPSSTDARHLSGRGVWHDTTNAIDILDIRPSGSASPGGNFVTGSRFRLYGRDR